MTRNAARPVVYGEVLFDRFEDTAVLGGAPFNVAWHLQGFGLQPLLISRVGSDAAGAEVRDTMQAWGMDLAGLQRDDAHPTGAVEVALHNGQPSYTILSEQAYDFIDADQARSSLANVDGALLYHGTLIARSKVSRDSLFACIETSRLPVFVDVNLRAPWWEHALIDRALDAAHWVKLNHEELAELERHPPLAADALVERARGFCRMRKLELLIVTEGERGASFVSADAVYADRPAPVQRLVDTVGAGDAFASVCIYGLLQGWPQPVTLRRALDFAARICEIRGATAADPNLYQTQKENWQHG